MANAGGRRIGDVEITNVGDHVAMLEIRRGPDNFFDEELISHLADAMTTLDADSDCRAVVLASEGKHFCAGANFSGPSRPGGDRSSSAGASAPSETNPLYAEAVRLFRTKKHVVAAIQGAAVGGGFGLAMFADFRVGCREARFTANFVKLGFTPGFGLTSVLPRVIGHQAANELFATGKRIDGEEAARLGILDRLVERDRVRAAAVEFAREIAVNAPLALLSLRKQMRGDLADVVQTATNREHAEQSRLQRTQDFKEGVKSVAERRPGDFRAC